MVSPTSIDSQDIPHAMLGSGQDALLLPPLSAISTREEMLPLADQLRARLACKIPDWPGFGNLPRARVDLSPPTMHAFLDRFIERSLVPPAIGIAVGHAATYLVEAARRHPGTFERLVLIAPTWRGPLPTAMGSERRHWFGRIRKAIELPGLGHLLYRLNVSRPVMRKMMSAHVYADPATLTADLMAKKRAVTRQKNARFSVAAFVTGGLDPADKREAFLALFDQSLPPTLVLRPKGAPPKSAAEMDALTATGRTFTKSVPGALAPHEEFPDEVAAAILAFLDGDEPAAPVR